MPLRKVDKDIESIVKKATAAVKRSCYNNAVYLIPGIDSTKDRPISGNGCSTVMYKND